MIRVADFLVSFLADRQVSQVFLVTGGGAMHLNDALGRNRNLSLLCSHHEQASAIAAEGYARITGGLAVVCVTTGPGSLNTLTGVMGQWTDSVPVLYLSGQVKMETTLAACPDLPLRQLGDQEVDIVRIVKPLTKFAATITRPQDARKILEEALFWAMEGRRGPVWVNVPLDIQGALVDPAHLEPFHPPAPQAPASDPSLAGKVVHLLQAAKRPLIVAGHGIRLAGAVQEFGTFLEKCRVPVATTHNGRDVLPTSHPLYAGQVGTLGDRAGNFALQRADLVLSIGSRNNIRQVSYNWANYGRNATLVSVDIDPAELKKPLRKVDVPVCLDALHFLSAMNAALQGVTLERNEWVAWCRQRRQRYPVALPEYHQGPRIHPYAFVEILTGLLPEGECIVAGNGSASVCLFQAAAVKPGQRLIYNSGCAAMGYDLPAAIGACLGSGKKRVICLAGDGSLSMNIQELQTVWHHRLPILLFVLNNRGYASIRQTQDTFFGGHRVGCDFASGVSFPDFCLVGKAFGLPSQRLDDPRSLRSDLARILSEPGPALYDVVLDENYVFAPKVASLKMPDGTMVSKSFEDMFPFLSPEEAKEHQS